MVSLVKQCCRYAIAGLLAVAFLSGCQSTGADGKPLTQAQILQKRDATLQMSKVGLDLLIRHKPAIQKEIDQAAGYAVFSATNVNIVLIV